MDAIFFSKNNFTNILDTVEETIQNKYGKTIKEGSKYKHKLLDTMKKVYQNKASFNISPLMTDDNIIVVLAQKTIKIFTLYLEQSIDYLPIVTNDIESSEDTLNNYGALHMTGDAPLSTLYSSTPQTFEGINNEFVSFKDGKGKLFSGGGAGGGGGFGTGALDYTKLPPYRYDILIDLSGYSHYDIKFESGTNTHAGNLQTIYIPPPHVFSCVDKIKINRLIIESPWEQEDYLNKKFLEYKFDNASKQLSGAIVNLSGALDIYNDISGALKQTLIDNQANRPVNPNSAIFVTKALFDLSGAKELYENASGDLCTIVNQIHATNYFPPYWNNVSRTCAEEKASLNTYVSNLSGVQLERDIEISKNNFDLSVLETERLRVLLDTLSGSLDEVGLSGETLRTFANLPNPNSIPDTDLTNIANISGSIIELNYENSKLEKEHKLEDIQTALFNLSGTVIDLSGLSTLRDNTSSDLINASNNYIPLNLLYEVNKARYDYIVKANAFNDIRDGNFFLFNNSATPPSEITFSNASPASTTIINIINESSSHLPNTSMTRFSYNNISLYNLLASAGGHILLFEYTKPPTLDGLPTIENINVFEFNSFDKTTGKLDIKNHICGENKGWSITKLIGIVPLMDTAQFNYFKGDGGDLLKDPLIYPGDYNNIIQVIEEIDQEIRVLRNAGHNYEVGVPDLAKRPYFVKIGTAIEIPGQTDGSNDPIFLGNADNLQILFETSLAKKNVALENINDLEIEFNDASGKYFNKLYETQQLESIYTGISGEYVNINSIYEFRRAVKNYKEFLNLSGQIGGVTNDLNGANTHMSNTLQFYNLDKTRFTYYDTSIKKEYANTLYTSVLSTHISGKWEIEDLDVAAQVKFARANGEVTFAQKLKLSAEQIFNDASGNYNSYIDKDESVPYILVKFQKSTKPTGLIDDAYIINNYVDYKNNITTLYPTNQISKWVHYTNEEMTVINYELSALERKELRIALSKPDQTAFIGKCKLSISINGYKI